jgi:hypothetical protein
MIWAKGITIGSTIQHNKMEEGKMKKLVCFTAVMALVLAGAAFAQTTVTANDNTVPIALGSGATAVAVPIEKSLNDNTVAVNAPAAGRDINPVNTKVDDSLNNNKVNVATAPGAQAAGGDINPINTKVDDSLNNNKVNVNTGNGQIAGRDTNPINTDVKLDDSLNNNKVAVGSSGTQSGQIAGRDNQPVNTNSYNTQKTEVDVAVKDSLNNNKIATQNAQIGDRYDNHTINVVDNAILANVNVSTPGTLTTPDNDINFTKSQHSEIGCSFRDYNGVSNTNAATGNLNSQKAFTSISIGSIGEGRGH